MLAALALAAGVQAPGLHTQAWLDTLRTVVRVERASLCVDVDESRRPAPLLYAGPDGERGLDRLSVAIGRSRTVVSGVHVFRRRMEPNDLRTASPHEHAMWFLNSLGVTEMNRLRRGDLNFSTLPWTVQRRLRYAVASLGDGLGDSMLAQYPERIGLRLLFDPVAVAEARTNDGQVSLLLYAQKTPVPVPEPLSTSDLEPLGRPADGLLDFGEGSILTLKQVMERAEIAFGKTFDYDRRLALSRYFVSGVFTEDRLLSVMEAMTVTTPLIAVEPPGPTELAEQRDRLVAQVFGPLGGEEIGVSDVTYGDLIAGRSTSFQSLYGARAPHHVQVFMARYRLQPDDEVFVQGDLSLAVGAPGMALLDTGRMDPSGRPIPYSSPHYLRIAFSSGRGQ